MVARMLAMQEETIERLATPNYSVALAAVSAEHGIPTNELQDLFTAHAARVANTESSPSLESAKALLAAGQFEEAEKAATQFAILLQAHIQDANEALLGARSGQIDAWLTAARAALHDGRNDAALQFANNAIALCSPERDVQEWLMVQRTLIVALLATHQPGEALRILQHSVEIRKANEIDDVNQEFADRYNLATILMHCGELANAELMFGGSFELANKEFGRDDKRLAITLLGLSQVKLERNDLVAAEDVARKYLGLLSDHDRLDTLEAALGFYNLAKILRLRKNNEKSLEMYQQSLQVYRNCLPPKHPTIALCQNDIGLLHLQNDKLVKAVSCFIDAIEIVQQTKPVDQLMASMYIANLGRAYLLLKQPEDAAERFTQAIEIRTACLGPDHPKVVELITLLDRTRLSNSV
jgi:tetratricopeptide (TPR) repeat protein